MSSDPLPGTDEARRPTGQAVRLLVRGFFLEAPFNPEGQQRGGLAWILETDPPPRRTDAFNANPTLAGLLTGWWGSGRREGWVERRQSVAAALGALGDRLVWGTLRPLALVCGVMATALGPAAAALAVLVVYNPAELALRWRSVRSGLSGPSAVLRDLGREGLPRFARPLASLLAITAGFFGAFWLAGFLRDGRPVDAAGGALGLLAAWFAHRGRQGDPWRGVWLALLVSVVWIGVAAVR